MTKTNSNKFRVDLDEKFTPLLDPPIVEAVLQWSAPAGEKLSREALNQALIERLPAYPTHEDHYETQFQFQLAMDDDSAAPPPVREGGWKGLRLRSQDEKNIAVFSQSGLTYSRLKPYEGWQAFEAEARRLWEVFRMIAKPDRVERMGLRFINRIPLDPGADLNKYLVEPPTEPGGLPLISFLYQSGFKVEEDGLFVNVVKTMQEDQTKNIGLILDIDVVTREGFPVETGKEFDSMLPKMRWLKNKVFFELLQPKWIEPFKEGESE